MGAHGHGAHGALQWTAMADGECLELFLFEEMPLTLGPLSIFFAPGRRGRPRPRSGPGMGLDDDLGP